MNLYQHEFTVHGLVFSKGPDLNDIQFFVELPPGHAAAYAAAKAAARDAVEAAERREQLKILAEFGNPFEED